MRAEQRQHPAGPAAIGLPRPQARAMRVGIREPSDGYVPNCSEYALVDRRLQASEAVEIGELEVESSHDAFSLRCKRLRLGARNSERLLAQNRQLSLQHRGDDGRYRLRRHGDADGIEIAVKPSRHVHVHGEPRPPVRFLSAFGPLPEQGDHLDARYRPKGGKVHVDAESQSGNSHAQRAARHGRQLQRHAITRGSGSGTMKLPL